MLSVFLPLPLPCLHPNSPYVQQGEREREFFSVEEARVGRGIRILSHSPASWPRYFLPFVLTAQASSLGKKIGNSS